MKFEGRCGSTPHAAAETAQMKRRNLNSCFLSSSSSERSAVPQQHKWATRQTRNSNIACTELYGLNVRNTENMTRKSKCDRFVHLCLISKALRSRQKRTLITAPTVRNPMANTSKKIAISVAKRAPNSFIQQGHRICRRSRFRRCP